MTLKKEIMTQLRNDLVSSKLNFAVGYVKSGTNLWIRTASDIQDVWKFVHGGDHLSLWCNGCYSKNPQDSSESDGEDDLPASSKKPRQKKGKRASALDKVDEIVTNLRQKHGSQYTTIQYRLWAEMVDVCTHK